MVYDGLTVLIRDSVCVFVVIQSGDDEVKITVFVIKFDASRKILIELAWNIIARYWKK